MRLIQIENQDRKHQINSIRHAKDVARYTGAKHFLYIDTGTDEIIGFSRPKGQRNWAKEAL